MLTLRRFRRLAASYGADLQRWPEEVRRDAQALLDHSAEAGALLEEARTLDQAIDEAAIREDALLWPQGERDAALDRLRSGVEARLVSPVGPRPGSRRFAWPKPSVRPATSLRPAAAIRLPLSLPLFWMGMTAGGVLAVVAGLLIGAMQASAPASYDVLSLLQPAPIHIFTE